MMTKEPRCGLLLCIETQRNAPNERTVTMSTVRLSLASTKSSLKNIHFVLLVCLFVFFAFSKNKYPTPTVLTRTCEYL